MKTIITLIFAFLLFSGSIFGQVWVQEDSLPAGNGLLKPFSFSINGILYVGGGYTGADTLSTFFAYNPSTNTWTQKANVPIGIYATQDFVLNGKGYFACGGLPGPTNLVYMYDPSSDTWTQKGNFPGTSRENGVGFSLNGKGYISGGFIGGSSLVNDMWQYNDTTDTWIQMANVPGPARNGPMFLVINNQAFIGLGGNINSSAIYSDFYLFNPDSNTYTQIASIPEGRAAGANFTYQNYGYVGLGQVASGLADDFYKYDPIANTWTLADSFGGGARAHVFNETVAGVPYVGCGSNSIGTFVSDNWSYGYPTGISDIAKPNSAILCYPSPSSGSFTIDLSGFDNGNKQISIYDQLGQIVYQMLASQNKILVGNAIASGIYTVSVTQGESTAHTRIIIE